MSSEGALTHEEVYKGTYTSGLIGRIFYELNILETDTSIEQHIRILIGQRGDSGLLT